MVSYVQDDEGNEADDEDETEDDDAEQVLDGTVVKPLKRKRRKYSSSDEGYFDRADSRRRLAQEV